jgi:diguanylate cyclase (GGDEF)-like protein/PAS domain S-box-containing protein
VRTADNDLGQLRDLALGAIPDPVIVIDAEATLLWGNRAAEGWTGWTLDELQGASVASLVHPDDAATAMASLASVQHKTYGSAVEVRVRDRLGVYRHAEIRGAAVPGQEGIVTLVLRDVTDRRRWEVASGDAALLEAILDHAPGMTMLLDGSGRLRGSSRALTTLLGWTLETTLGSHLASLAAEPDRERVRLELTRLLAEPSARASFDAAFAHQDGHRSMPLALTAVNLVDDGAVEGVVVTAVDITELVEARSRLEHQASHDSLTGLPNRVGVWDKLHQALAEADRRRSTVGVLFCDLDGLKTVNDRHGHRAGDGLLLEVGRRLAAALRTTDVVGRLSGDEFVVIAADVDGDELDQLADRLRAAVAGGVDLPAGRAADAAISVGAVLADGSSTVEDVLDRADAAMYSDKASKQRQLHAR